MCMHSCHQSCAQSHDEVKKALLLRYDLTEDGFRLRFRSSRPEGAETFAQHSVRSANYLTRWIEMADAPKHL